MERGVKQQPIFHDANDYELFLKILRISAIKYNCCIHAFCMMTNHFHLLLETGDQNIADFMRLLATRYAVSHNKKYDLKGHLFESRYVAKPVSSDEYFLQTSRYIHLNPVKANIVSRPESYPWSSYRNMFTANDDDVMKYQKTLNYFSPNARAGYRSFVELSSNKYENEENEIMKDMRENELWLPK